MMLKAWQRWSMVAMLVAVTGVTSAATPEPSNWRQQALDHVLAGIHSGEKKSTAAAASEDAPVANWQMSAKVFVDGDVRAFEAARGNSLQQAARLVGQRLAQSLAGFDPTQGRMLLTVKGPGINGIVVEYEGKALQVVGDVTAIPTVDADRVLAAVRAQRDYLLRQIDPVHHGFFKVYSARSDRRQEKLRTTYTASAIWTLLQMRDVEADPRIDAVLAPAIDFLLSMQVAKGPQQGAFYYSFNPANGEKRERFVVGSVAKTVFTLLELSRRNGEPRYLDAAKRAGEWLLTRVQKDGGVLAVTSRDLVTGKWKTFDNYSVLYSGETLSALSRLYAATNDSRYRRAAKRIAQKLVAEGEANGFVFGDDFRRPNTISTSWVAMALFDYTAAIPSPAMEKAMFSAGNQILSRQHVEPDKLLDDGRFFDTWATSGNGWMNEVLVSVYQRCLQRGRADCPRYRLALRRTTRWLVQNTYSPENSYHIPNPERARGGSIRNDKVEEVRTDAVCHAGNSLIGVLQIMAAEQAPMNTSSMRTGG